MILNSTLKCIDSRYQIFFQSTRYFIPSTAETENKKFYYSLAIGIGPRACIGQRLALLIVKMMLIAIFSNYTLSYGSNKHSDDNSTIHVFTYAVDGLYVQFKKIRHLLN
ncbi:PREDICTED: uncharacterized protein LOC105455129 isoform X2 [Wasmannia auropunctata]|uniref:uncharacterized protein LOC105455129 isoform X2 n=1 Tax=Wasmannia auropunctata TaxID=64793 RepID=UPI0005EE0DCB|nr:PREDICTED: uncharacterized protein LOC105455129 isoform X2 [Wasmannia auropunctata]